MGKTWIIPSFFLKNRKSTNSIYLFIYYFYTHRLIRSIYKYGVVNLNSGHKSIECRVYIWNYLYLIYIFIYMYISKLLIFLRLHLSVALNIYIVCSPQQSCEMELQNNRVLTYEGCFGFHWVANAKESKPSWKN